MEDDCVSYRQTCQDTDGTLDCARELKLKVVEFSPEQYFKLKQTLKSMEYDQRKAPVLAAPKAELAEADPKPDDERGARRWNPTRRFWRATRNSA